MGLLIENREFTPEDYRNFSRRLEENLAALEALLHSDNFGDTPPLIGAELELYILNQQLRPEAINREILQAAQDPRLTLELNRYNLEFNFDPLPLNETAFSFSTSKIFTTTTEEVI